MSSLLYFVPDKKAGLSANEIREIGLDYALDGPVHQQTVSDGPGGVGVVLADARHCDPGRVRYVADEQEWLKIPAGWLGRWKGETMEPSDLIRAKPLDGHFVELADGRQWLCPVARTHVIQQDKVRWEHALPVCVGMDENRRWSPGEVVPQYRRLWEISLAWWDAKMSATAPDAEVGDTIRMDFEGIHTIAAECLAVNYRLGSDEISLLGLFDTDSARKILDALIDLPTVIALGEELEKKTASRQADG